jgi:hypothetical protein
MTVLWLSPAQITAIANDAGLDAAKLTSHAGQFALIGSVSDLALFTAAANRELDDAAGALRGSEDTGWGFVWSGIALD